MELVHLEQRLLCLFVGARLSELVHAADFATNEHIAQRGLHSVALFACLTGACLVAALQQMSTTVACFSFLKKV